MCELANGAAARARPRLFPGAALQARASCRSTSHSILKQPLSQSCRPALSVLSMERFRRKVVFQGSVVVGVLKIFTPAQGKALFPCLFKILDSFLCIFMFNQSINQSISK